MWWRATRFTSRGFSRRDAIAQKIEMSKFTNTRQRKLFVEIVDYIRAMFSRCNSVKRVRRDKRNSFLKRETLRFNDEVLGAFFES